MICDAQNRLLLQFHITGRCNLRCKHCYRTEGDVEKLSLADVKNVIDQFLALRERYNAQYGIKKVGHINLTGGEPFFRKDIKEILRYIASFRGKLTFGILSNGSFIDEDIISLLKETQVSFVQLSIDGDPKTHDSLRAKGDYHRVFGVARMLEKAGIPTYISFTANKLNYRQLPVVAKQCRRCGVTKLWSDRLVPIGNGEELEQYQITAEDLPLYLKTLKIACGSFLARLLYPKTEVSAKRALQFIGTNNSVYSCSAGNSLIVVDEFGRVMPCRRMPIICGDVFASNLTDIYYNDPVFLDLRKPHTPAECAGCMYRYLCAGGARCQSYAQYGTYLRADPACPCKE